MAELATADASLSAARAALYESMHHVWASAVDDVDIDAELRARSWNAAQHAVDVGISVADTAHRLAGSAAVHRCHPFQRALADAMTARQHILFSQHFRPVIGKALAGIEVSCPPFL